MDHIGRISVFLEVVKYSSFIGAGRALGMSGPAVSKQIQALEAELGVKLLLRTTRHVSTTDEGAQYYERTQKALADIQAAAQEIQESRECPSGRLKINAPMSFGVQYLSSPLAEFARRYPDVDLEVDFSDRWVDVVNEGYDLVVRIGHLQDSGLIARKLGECPLILCAAPKFALRYPQVSHPQDLLTVPAVVYSRHGQMEEWKYQHHKSHEQGSVRLNRVFASNSGEQERAAILAGVGVGVLPIFLVADQLANGELIQLLPEYRTVPERQIYALYPPNKFLATRVRLLLDWLVECGASYPWVTG